MNKMRKKLSMVVLGVVLVMALSVTAFASSAWDSFSTKLHELFRFRPRGKKACPQILTGNEAETWDYSSHYGKPKAIGLR